MMFKANQKLKKDRLKNKLCLPGIVISPIHPSKDGSSAASAALSKQLFFQMKTEMVI